MAALESSGFWLRPRIREEFTAQNGSHPTDHHQGDGMSHMIGELRLGDKRKKTQTGYHVGEPHGHAAG